MTGLSSNAFASILYYLFPLIGKFKIWKRYEAWINSTEWIKKSIKDHFCLFSVGLSSFLFFFLVSRIRILAIYVHILIKIAQCDHFFDDCLWINIKMEENVTEFSLNFSLTLSFSFDRRALRNMEYFDLNKFHRLNWKTNLFPLLPPIHVRKKSLAAFFSTGRPH